VAYKYYFKTYEEITSFITYAQDLLEWGCRTFRMSNSVNAVLDLDTTNYASSNSNGCVRFGDVVGYINQYYTQNNEQPVTLEIKLICPESFRAELDRENYYRAFFLTFYSSKKIHYMNLGYSENGNTLQTSPYIVYAGYIQNLFDKWKTYYANEYES
jgi:hypothetical protein